MRASYRRVTSHVASTVKNGSKALLVSSPPFLIILVEYKCVVGVHNLWAHISQLGPSSRHFSAPK